MLLQIQITLLTYLVIEAITPSMEIKVMIIILKEARVVVPDMKLLEAMQLFEEVLIILVSVEDLNTSALLLRDSIGLAMIKIIGKATALRKAYMRIAKLSS